MQLTHIAALLALAASTTALPLSRSSSFGLLERSYVGGPVAYARAVLALRHAATSIHRAETPRAEPVPLEAFLAELDTRTPADDEPLDPATAAAVIARRKGAAARRDQSADADFKPEPALVRREAEPEPQPQPEPEPVLAAMPEEAREVTERNDADAFPRIWGYRV